MYSPRVLRTHPLLARLVLFILLPLAAAGGWVAYTVAHNVPAQGTTQLAGGVFTRTSVTRDAHGVAHVRAESDRDAFYAIGFAHAQDRAWQLEVQRRFSRGRLSEVFGKDSIDVDVWIRTLGLYDAARSAWPALSEQAKASLTAYAAGVNDALVQSAATTPEFRMFGVTPEPWTEIDSLAWIKVFALNLGGNYRREIDRYLANRLLTPDQASVLFPGYPREVNLPAPSVAGVQGLMALSDAHDGFQRDLGLARTETGSNAWVVAGRHTQGGEAILANDPHMGLQIPSLWYVARFEAPGFKAAGMTLVGLPVVVFGRNDSIAWGGTNMMADAQDLFVERPDASGEHYQRAGRWQPFAVRKETIQVRAEVPQRLHRPYVPVTLNVRSTVNGPLISDHFKVFDAPVSLRWTALDAADTSYEAFFRLNYAKDWAGFRNALALHVAPALNMLYADRAGNIGYLGAGRIPLRRQGEGTVPVPGWDEAFGWSGAVAPALWPQTFNPPSGFIVSANHRTGNAEHPYFISHDWASPARQRRIEQLLNERIATGNKIAATDMQRIQADTLDLDAAAVASLLRGRLHEPGLAREVARQLEGWNGDMAADSSAASIYHVWMRHLRQEIFSPRLQAGWANEQGARLLSRLGESVRADQLVEVLRDDRAGWCDAGAGMGGGPCASALASSQRKALDELHKLGGTMGTAGWKWGKIQRTVYAHSPLSRVKPFDVFFERRTPNGGSSGSINVSSSRYAHSEGYLQDFGPGFRQVISMSPKGVDHLYMNSTGQSGNVLSPHYDDMIRPFRDAQLFRLDDGGAQPRATAGATKP